MLTRSNRCPHLLGTVTVKKPYRIQLDNLPTLRLDLQNDWSGGTIYYAKMDKYTMLPEA